MSLIRVDEEKAKALVLAAQAATGTSGDEAVAGQADVEQTDSGSAVDDQD